MSETVIVTEAARDLIARLKTRYGSLMFVQSGAAAMAVPRSACKGANCFLWPNDLLLGESAGCPFYIDQERYERWRRPQFLIDVSLGESDTFSLDGPGGSTLRRPHDESSRS